MMIDGSRRDHHDGRDGPGANVLGLNAHFLHGDLRDFTLTVTDSRVITVTGRSSNVIGHSDATKMAVPITVSSASWRAQSTTASARLTLRCVRFATIGA
jgi:hypothetical protein